MKSALQTERLVLRVLEEADADLALDYVTRNRAFLAPWEPAREPEYFTIESQTRVLRNEAELIKTGSMIKLWIFKTEQPERAIGTVTLSNIVRGAFLSCHLGYKLDQSELRIGYMTEAVREVVRYAFEELGLHRIEANIMPRNEASMNVVCKLGFYEEGLAYRYLKINGVWEDHIHMVLRNE
ncbi:GNAT family N-acetyltransferase [Paenibacillus ginsengarvi]|uniref:GNAT family N-acetyltransferase n=1 Tax=Paenibacillus ginsengarvi TaxID=400777 RepID=A0A3B0CFL2_9BACL|nr:GNAT family N-acetyltransferase [Paenibacillus ginsengarvi]RKN84212.1 GNAT family N-acetyltransferase [Paenibacillus ginsengarvi]